MLAMLLAALELVGKLLADNDYHLAKQVVGRVLRISGGSGDEAERADALRGYLEGMARDRSSSATTFAMRRRSETD